MENRIFEVSNENVILWEYTSNDGSDMIPRAMKYGSDYFTNNLETKDINKDILSRYRLSDNYPNPFNPITIISYGLPVQTGVTITIYDMMGRQVKSLINGLQTPGYKTIQWNATNDKNHPVSAGLYLYTIQAGDYSQTKKMVLLK
ncbi:MAG: T9SS type A sorting domain-containing protein [Fidelibacterota bacterium]|jgi:hypothetical protein